MLTGNGYAQADGRVERGAVGGSNILFIILGIPLKMLGNNRILGQENHLVMVFEKQGWGKYINYRFFFLHAWIVLGNMIEIV